MAYGQEIGYAAKECAPSTLGGLSRSPSITERLHDRKANLEIQLQQVNEALAALESNPGVARAVDAIAKLGF